MRASHDQQWPKKLSFKLVSLNMSQYIPYHILKMGSGIFHFPYFPDCNEWQVRECVQILTLPADTRVWSMVQTKKHGGKKNQNKTKNQNQNKTKQPTSISCLTFCVHFKTLLKLFEIFIQGRLTMDFANYMIITLSFNSPLLSLSSIYQGRRLRFLEGS